MTGKRSDAALVATFFGIMALIAFTLPSVISIQSLAQIHVFTITGSVCLCAMAVYVIIDIRDRIKSIN